MNNSTDPQQYELDLSIEPIDVEVTELKLLSPTMLELDTTYISGDVRLCREEASEWKVNAETNSTADGDRLMHDLKAELGPAAQYYAAEVGEGDIYITTSDPSLVGPIVRVANRHLRSYAP